jgi:hypothetical protein
MKQVGIVNHHSFVDVITNSSTELFIGDLGKTLEFVKELLQDFLDISNKSNATNKSFSSVFDEPYIYTKDIHKEYVESAEKYSKRRIDKLTKDLKKAEKENSTNYYESAKFFLKELNEVNDLFDIEGNFLYEKYDTNWGFEKDENIGKLIIKGSGDNSIPYELFDLIENTLFERWTGERFHLG